jgi:hypothetical protein
MSAAPYMLGRPLRKLTPGGDVVDSLFASDRIDDTVVEDVTFAHCTFANVSFKGCTVRNTRFIDCVFANCYFRGTKLASATFSGCKFIDCDLSKVDVRTCDFKFYNSFTKCHIRFGEMRNSFPSEGNLRAHLCANLSREARMAGDISDSEKYRQAAAKGMEDHLWAAVTHQSAFYREKYRGTVRLSVLIEYVASKSRGYLWGYRRSWLVVLRNWAALNLLFFPGLFLLLRKGVERRGRPANLWDLWLGSIGNTLPGAGISDVEFISPPAQIVAFLEVLLAVVFGALVTALLFRSIFERA